MATKSFGPIRGIRYCDACGLSETSYGYSEKAICQCNISDAKKLPYGRFSPPRYFGSEEKPDYGTPRFRR